ncbi:hypothetical protein V8G54_033714 [Vigna mungo]|uniref:Bifunctional inhibitor/plant lipid transfer protein/seed storage helical domain-containing protein n=1 Tax=Vigna mungo TaxID=3915 RepID=A0AAQ3MPH5_VIGMU
MLLCEKDIEVHLLELKPNIVFFDHAYWVPKPRLTQCLKIKSLVYHVISFSSLTCESSYSHPLGISKGYCCNIAEHHPLLHEQKFLAGSGKVDHGKGIVHTESCTNSILTQSYATGLKGCTVIEGAYADCHRRHVTVPKEATCLIDENCAKWLGNYEAGSVVYCSFGSECTLEPCQFQEVVLGLELSGMPFVAALRPPKGFECVESALPKGFKERVQGRGVVSSACFPHRFILEHPSVGCFVTLCGHSGSLSGALVNKCQLVLLPKNHGEMVFSAGVIGTTLKVGVEAEKFTTKRIRSSCLENLVKENMTHTSGNVRVQWLLATLLIVMLGGAKAIALCDTESSKLSACYAAVTGQHPPKPSEKCCDVVKHSNLPCLCRYKSVLPAFGFNPTNALALPSKCGLKTPPECRGNSLMPE